MVLLRQQMNDSAFVICLMGPTASGKTDLALQLAEQFPIEIINVDSAQIYREMNIGSGKSEPQILESIPHHLINILDPKESYSAWQFRIDALGAIKEIKAKGKIPLLVGGTMLYFKSLQQGFSELPASTTTIRSKVLEMANMKGWEATYQQLQTVDPITAKRLSPNDRQRISRALEVYEMTMIPLSQWLARPIEAKGSYQYINIALSPITTPRAILHERIHQRFEAMLQAGLIEEVNALKSRGDLSLALPALRAVGYRQIWEHLNGEYTFDEMKEKAIASTRQLAKRQLTWLRHWSTYMDIDFLDPNALSILSKIITSH